MTFEHLNIVYTNALCCSSELAIKVSDLYSRGDKCADSEMLKLKILLDKLDILKSILCEGSDNLIINGTFNTDLSGWTVNNWIWDIQGPYNCAYYNGNGNPATLSQNILTVGETYDIFFDFLYDDNGSGLPSNLSINAGTSSETINVDTYIGFITDPHIVTLTCTDSTLFSFSVNGGGEHYILDNIVVKKRNNNCLTEEQIDNLVHDIMKECNICDCQLK